MALTYNRQVEIANGRTLRVYLSNHTILRGFIHSFSNENEFLCQTVMIKEMLRILRFRLSKETCIPSWTTVIITDSESVSPIP